MSVARKATRQQKEQFFAQAWDYGKESISEEEIGLSNPYEQAEPISLKDEELVPLIGYMEVHEDQGQEENKYEFKYARVAKDNTKFTAQEAQNLVFGYVRPEHVKQKTGQELKDLEVFDKAKQAKVNANVTPYAENVKAQVLPWQHEQEFFTPDFEHGYAFKGNAVEQSQQRKTPLAESVVSQEGDSEAMTTPTTALEEDLRTENGQQDEEQESVPYEAPTRKEPNSALTVAKKGRARRPRAKTLHALRKNLVQSAPLQQQEEWIEPTADGFSQSAEAAYTEPTTTPKVLPQHVADLEASFAERQAPALATHAVVANAAPIQQEEPAPESSALGQAHEPYRQQTQQEAVVYAPQADMSTQQARTAAATNEQPAVTEPSSCLQESASMQEETIESVTKERMLYPIPRLLFVVLVAFICVLICLLGLLLMQPHENDEFRHPVEQTAQARSQSVERVMRSDSLAVDASQASLGQQLLAPLAQTTPKQESVVEQEKQHSLAAQNAVELVRALEAQEKQQEALEQKSASIEAIKKQPIASQAGEEQLFAQTQQGKALEATKTPQAQPREAYQAKTTESEAAQSADMILSKAQLAANAEQELAQQESMAKTQTELLQFMRKIDAALHEINTRLTQLTSEKQDQTSTAHPKTKSKTQADKEDEIATLKAARAQLQAALQRAQDRVNRLTHEKAELTRQLEKARARSKSSAASLQGWKVNALSASQVILEDQKGKLWSLAKGDKTPSFRIKDIDVQSGRVITTAGVLVFAR